MRKCGFLGFLLSRAGPQVPIRGLAESTHDAGSAQSALPRPLFRRKVGWEVLTRALRITHCYVMSLTNVLAAAIERAPCSIREMARRVGISHVHLAAVLNGTQRPTPRIAVGVAKALEEMSAQATTDALRIRAELSKDFEYEKIDVPPKMLRDQRRSSTITRKPRRK